MKRILRLTASVSPECLDIVIPLSSEVSYLFFRSSAELTQHMIAERREACVIRDNRVEGERSMAE